MVHVKSTTRHYIHSITALNRNIHLFLSTVLLVGFVFDGGIYSVIFNLYLVRLDYDTAFIGQVNSAGLFAFALTSLPAGFIGKRWGARRMMIAGLNGMLLACLLIPMAEFGPSAWQKAMLTFGYVFMLFSLAFYFVNALPFVTANTSPAERDQAFSVQAAFFSLSAFLGSLVGGILPNFFAATLSTDLADRAPYRYPLLLGAVLIIPGIWAMMQAQPETLYSDEPDEPDVSDETGLETRADYPETLSLTLIIMLVFVRFLQVSGMAAAMIFFNVYLDTQLLVSTVFIGVLISVARLVAAPAALATPYWTKKKGSVYMITFASFGSSLAMLPLAFFPHWLPASIGYIAAITFSSMRFPAFLSYSMTLVPPRQRAIVSGAGEMAAGLSFGAMSLSGGFIVDAVGYREFFLFAFVLSFLGGAAFWAYFRVPRGILADNVKYFPQ
ncbi:MAG: MFS transporter [Chloroflexota bacterium]